MEIYQEVIAAPTYVCATSKLCIEPLTASAHNDPKEWVGGERGELESNWTAWHLNKELPESKNRSLRLANSSSLEPWPIQKRSKGSCCELDWLPVLLIQSQTCVCISEDVIRLDTIWVGQVIYGNRDDTKSLRFYWGFVGEEHPSMK